MHVTNLQGGSGDAITIIALTIAAAAENYIRHRSPANETADRSHSLSSAQPAKMNNSRVIISRSGKMEKADKSSDDYRLTHCECGHQLESRRNYYLRRSHFLWTAKQSARVAEAPILHNRNRHIFLLSRRMLNCLYSIEGIRDINYRLCNIYWEQLI